MDSAGWAVFETVQPGNRPIMFADGIAYEARSAIRVLGRQRGARYLHVVDRVVATGAEVEERAAGQNIVGQAIKGPTGLVHAVAVWIGTGEPPSRPAVDSWDIDFEKGTSAASGELDEVWDDGRAKNTEYAWQGFLQIAHPDDVLRMTRLVNQFVDADPGLLVGLQWSVKRGDGWASLQSYGRYVLDDGGAPLWRGHSVDLTGVGEVRRASRSVFGALVSAGGQQVAILDLVGGPGPIEGPHIIHWLDEGLPEIAWPDDGWLGAIIHPDDQAAARFDLVELSRLPVEESTSARFRMRGTNIDWVEVDVASTATSRHDHSG